MVELLGIIDWGTHGLDEKCLVHSGYIFTTYSHIRLLGARRQKSGISAFLYKYRGPQFEFSIFLGDGEIYPTVQLSSKVCVVVVRGEKAPSVVNINSYESDSKHFTFLLSLVIQTMMSFNVS